MCCLCKLVVALCTSSFLRSIQFEIRRRAKTRQKTSHSFGIICLKTKTFNRPDIHTGKAQRAAGGQDKQPEVGWFPWHLRERPLYARPRVTPCDEVVKINPPFHPARLLACVEAALMERIHTHNPLFDSNTFGLRDECMVAPCPLCFLTHNTACICTAVNDEELEDCVATELPAFLFK